MWVVREKHPGCNIYSSIGRENRARLLDLLRDCERVEVSGRLLLLKLPPLPLSFLRSLFTSSVGLGGRSSGQKNMSKPYRMGMWPSNYLDRIAIAAGLRKTHRCSNNTVINWRPID